MSSIYTRAVELLDKHIPELFMIGTVIAIVLTARLSRQTGDDAWWRNDGEEE